MSDSNRDINAELLQAVKSGDINGVKRLIIDRADVNAKENSSIKWTVLHHAVFSRHEGVVQALLDAKNIDVDAKDEYGNTPLYLATISKGEDNIQIIRHLLYKGASVNAKNDRGSTPLHKIAENDRNDAGFILDILLEQLEPDVNAQDQDGNTPLELAINNGKAEVVLRWAARRGHAEIVRDLLRVENINVDAKDLHGNTPLDEAVAENYHLEVIVILLSNGANSANLVNQYKWTPLHLAVAKGDVQGILNEQANANSVESENNWTPLHLALKKDKVDIDVLNALLGKEGIDVNLADKNGDTPLRLVLGKHNIDIDVLNALLGKEGIDVNLADKNGDTPLHLTLKKDKVDIDVLNALLRKEGIDVNLKDKNKDTPLFLVLKKDKVDIDVLNALLRKEGIDANLEDKNKDTPLFLVLKKDNIDINVLNALLEAKDINVNLMDSNKDAPLHSFLKRFPFKSNEIDIDVLNALLRKEGIDVNARDKDGETPLHWILRPEKINIKIVEALIKAGADVNIQDKDGKTPLHFAAQFNREKEVVEVLLKAEGINVNIKDEDGKTPFDLTTNEEIKTLFQKAAESPDAGLIDEPSTDNSGSGTPQTQQGTTSAGQGADVQNKGLNPVASTEPAQTEEQPSSFFGSLFSILMKPFSLIASFFGGVFSWLFGSNEEKIDESTSQTDASVSLPKLDSLDEKKIDAQPGNHSSLAPNQSAGQTDAPQLGADDNQLLG